MSDTVTVRLSDYAASEVQIRAECGADLDDEDVAAVLACWNGRSLTVPRSSLDTARRGLTTLSNACDEDAQRLKRTDPEEAHANRSASLGFTGATMRLLRVR